MFGTKKNRKVEKRCRKCFVYVKAGTRKCSYCGFVFKSPGKFLLDTVKNIFRKEEVYAADKIRKNKREKIFFTSQEIEYLFDARQYKILMYLVLSDINFLDETSLIKLGETLVSIENS